MPDHPPSTQTKLAAISTVSRKYICSIKQIYLSKWKTNICPDYQLTSIYPGQNCSHLNGVSLNISVLFRNIYLFNNTKYICSNCTILAVPVHQSNLKMFKSGNITNRKRKIRKGTIQFQVAARDISFWLLVKTLTRFIWQLFIPTFPHIYLTGFQFCP